MAKVADLGVGKGLIWYELPHPINAGELAIEGGRILPFGLLRFVGRNKKIAFECFAPRLIPFGIVGCQVKLVLREEYDDRGVVVFYNSEKKAAFFGVSCSVYHVSSHRWLVACRTGHLVDPQCPAYWGNKLERTEKEKIFVADESCFLQVASRFCGTKFLVIELAVQPYYLPVYLVFDEKGQEVDFAETYPLSSRRGAG